MEILKRILRGVLAFLGYDTSAVARADDLQKHLTACINGRQEEAARHAAVLAEKDRQIEELQREIEANTKPGDVLRRRLERVRGGGSGPDGAA